MQNTTPDIKIKIFLLLMLKFYLLILLVLCCFFIKTTKADEFEQHAQNSLISILTEELSNWQKKLQCPQDFNYEQVKILAIKFFDAKKRVWQIQKSKKEGLWYNAVVEDFLRTKYIPALRKILSVSGYTFDELRAIYELEKQKLQAQIQSYEVLLRQYYGILRTKYPGFEYVMSLTAFSRSNTLSLGEIGNWNPKDPNDIRQQSVEALYEVLHEIYDGKIKELPISIQLLQLLHEKLAKPAEHSLSIAGHVSNLQFYNQTIQRHIDVTEYLNKVDKMFKSSNLSPLIKAFRIYERLMHIHPFGDANGRISEIARQLVLLKYGLPPLLTREKISVETFYYQNSFGGGKSFDEVLNLAQETLNFMEKWLEILKPSDTILKVELCSDNIVVQVLRGKSIIIFVVKKLFELTSPMTEPFIKTHHIILGPSNAKNLFMRFTVDGWKSLKDIPPTFSLDLKRVGNLKASFVWYSVEIPYEQYFDTMEFLFYTEDKSGNKIWFKDKWKNYSVKLAPINVFNRCAHLFSLNHSILPLNNK